MSELPEGWTYTPVSQACTIVRVVTYNKTESSDEPLLEYLPVLRANNIQVGKLVFSDLVYVPRKCIALHQVIKAGDVVVAMSSGSKSVVGKAAKAESDWDGAFGAFCGVLRPSSEIDPRYFYFFTQSAEYRSRVSELSAGVNINNLKPAHFELIEMSIAPRAEQTRIAQKLDELLAQVDTLKARIDAIPALLKRFRQSVLAAAIDGTLTESWRQGSGIAFEWSTVVFSALLREFRGGASKKPSDLMEGVPVIRSSAVRSMTVDFSDIRYFDSETELNDRDFALEGDLLFTRLSGSPEFVGVCARVRTTPKRPTQFPDRLFCARLKDKNHGPYLEIFFASRAYLGYIRDNLKSSAGHQRITTEIVKNTLILLPSIAEQAEIVRRVEQLFAFADQLEAKVASAKSRIDHLTQSILAKAFRGELVPQDPNDEPASVLLERIKAQRAAAPKVKRGRKMTV